MPANYLVVVVMEFRSSKFAFSQPKCIYCNKGDEIFGLIYKEHAPPPSLPSLSSMCVVAERSSPGHDTCVLKLSNFKTIVASILWIGQKANGPVCCVIPVKKNPVDLSLREGDHPRVSGSCCLVR